MRRAVAICLLSLAGGCFLFEDEYPDEACKSDLDCFRAQGEVCDLESRRCEPAADAGSASLQKGGEG